MLKPGGKLIVCNEPFRNLKDLKLDPGHEVAEYEGHEHAYMRFSYTMLARRAGGLRRRRARSVHGLFRPGGIGISDRMNDRQIVAAAAGALARRRPLLKKAALASRAYARGHTSLHMVCTKPV